MPEGGLEMSKRRLPISEHALGQPVGNLFRASSNRLVIYLGAKQDVRQTRR